jgi:recombinational DNA repair protein RecR
MDATVDGQTTAHYLVELLSESDVSVTWLARGGACRRRVRLPG